MMYEREGDTQSPLERRFLEDCVTAGLVVEPQCEVNGMHADFAIPSEKIVIECDSQQYHSTPAAWTEDERRDRRYAEDGWAVIRLTGPTIFKAGEQIAEKIKLMVLNHEFEAGKLYRFYAYREADASEQQISVFAEPIDV